MCGIVGTAAKRPIAKILIDGLKQLEYRGYDSAGIALIDAEGNIDRYRVAGKVRALEEITIPRQLPHQVGIAHTRWATHGAPAEHNAHPFVSNNTLALVHNGIIENYLQLREQLLNKGYVFVSETDTEVAAHLIHAYLQESHDLLTAIRSATSVLEGAYAFCILDTHHPEHIYAIRKGSPLVIGRGNDENFLASDPLALLNVAQDFIYLEDGDIVDITANTITIHDHMQQPTDRAVHRFTMQAEATERGEHRHYMKKEIVEQPTAITACLKNRITENDILPALFGEQIDAVFPKVRHVTLIACGTSYHAASVARYWIESLTKIPCIVEIASEFRYRDVAPTQNSLFIALSQSGETADTLAALRMAKHMGYLSTLAICNVPGSSLAREAKGHCLTHAGIEIGVASTKAFSTQLITLLLLALTLRRHQNIPNDLLIADCVLQLQRCPSFIQALLQQDNQIIALAQSFTNKSHAIFMGRGMLYPIALEGALKMKEISYIHAEGYPAGELKHGPLALVDHAMPIISLVPHDALFDKNLSNIQEVRARGGQLIVLTDRVDQFQQIAFSDIAIIPVPTIHPLLTPILYTIPLQLLAYHVAVLKGTDVDQPRNLAKSVTVE
ncbi:MAG: glutamine--fructose-6-phosphate aminotransferase [Gammaproteobacteria bacterium RIFCSPHIGHO2_12_FULL_42_10]|nr:MAG: glutamine--fructose-6-phosphate aminotransferase [Gammaproteobacteria bacterium RIFCSPHIGHO2_12_FULL_42_10]